MNDTRSLSPVLDFGTAHHHLEALHWAGFTVTIHSPKTSPNGLYLVTAYGSQGRNPERLRACAKHLPDALKDVAGQLGELRLAAYAALMLDIEIGTGAGGDL
jgi:hypothetical protein